MCYKPPFILFIIVLTKSFVLIPYTLCFLPPQGYSEVTISVCFLDDIFHVNEQKA
jgi:hypothetical protein